MSELDDFIAELGLTEEVEALEDENPMSDNTPITNIVPEQYP